MSQITLNLCAKQPDPAVRYRFTPSLTINAKREFHFLNKEIHEEVKKLNKKQLKKYAKKLSVLPMTFVSAFVVGDYTVLAQPLFESQTQAPGISINEIMRLGFILTGVCAAILTIVAIISAQLAGGLRMFPKKRKMGEEWTQDVIKGYTQVLIAPVVIGLISLTTYLLFGDFEWFVNPLSD